MYVCDCTFIFAYIGVFDVRVYQYLMCTCIYMCVYMCCDLKVCNYAASCLRVFLEVVSFLLFKSKAQ